jgi:hypothetical protein
MTMLIRYNAIIAPAMTAWFQGSGNEVSRAAAMKMLRMA